MLSLKQIGTICFVFSLILISTKSFSENIPSNPTCDNATLGVYSGSVALEPDWGANEIPLRWYNNNTLITDVTAQESECTYDGTLDVATAPTRTGFTFKGWTVRPQIDFAALQSTLTLTGAQERWSVGKNYNTGARYCWHAVHTNNSVHEECSLLSEYTDLEVNEWKTETAQGMIYGSAYCSAKAGDAHSNSWTAEYKSDWSATIAELDAVSGDKKYCWCQVTGFRPMNGTAIEGPNVPLSWGFARVRGLPSDCLYDCASDCSYYVRRHVNFRTALFSTPVTNNQ